MRRSDREIKGYEEMIEVMKRCDVCRLALPNGDYPYILPLNFGMEVKGDSVTLYFHGAKEGMKYELMDKNPHASFEMDCSHRLVTDDVKMSCTMEYESVIGHGTLTYVDEEDKYDALMAIMRQYHEEDFSFNKAVMAHTTVFKMEVEDMTGKRRMVKR